MWHDLVTLIYMNATATDERLAWLAMREYVNKRAQPSILMRLLGAGSTLDHGYYTDRVSIPRSEAREMASMKHQQYAFAVDDASRELTPQERAVLRSTGRLPDWFIARVEQLRRANG